MRGLAGDFLTMPLKDLVVYLGNRRSTGALKLQRGSQQKQITLLDGVVINASSNQPREYVGQFLLNMGHITEEQFNKAYNTQRETNIFLGQILVMTGAVAEDVVRSALSLKFRETLLDAFGWQDGEFSYDPTASPPAVQGLDVSVDLLDVHREGEFRETAWTAIRAAFPSGQLELEVVDRNLIEKPQPGSLDEKLFGLIRDGHTIDSMALALHATDFFLYQRLYALFRLDAIKVREGQSSDIAGSGPKVVGDVASAGQVLAHARRFLQDKSYKDAEALARRAHELSPSTETADVLKQAEQKLLGELREQLLEKPRVPTLSVAVASLKSLPLSAPEKYLLSRIDGARDLSSIINASPLAQLDALKYFAKFLERKLVGFKAK